MKTLLILILLVISISASYAQIGINADNSAPHSSAMLDVKSNTKAFYPPRMTTTEKNGLVGKQAGAVVFDITLNQLSYYNGTEWLAASGAGGSLTFPFSKTANVENNAFFKLENTATNIGYGIYSSSSANDGYGFYGLSKKTDPTYDTYGVAGSNSSTNSKGIGVYGNHDGLGIGVKGVSQNGIGGYFSGSSATSYALVTNIGNVGIGTLTPTLSGLVVDKAVGNAHAVFGSNTAGLSLESNWPGISFNGYYNGGRKLLSDGFVGGLSMNPSTGQLILYNSAASGTKGTNIVGLERFVINNLGNVGIGTSSPSSKLDIKGTENFTHFYFGSNEDSYIRGGKATSNVIIGDVGNNVGLKTSLPYYDLTFKSDVGDKISFWGGETSATTNHYGIGIQAAQLQLFVPSSTENLVFGTGRSASFVEKMRISGEGNVGIGTLTPTLSGLVVDKAVGNAHAVFGSNTAGLSLESNWPGISFNAYYNGGRKPLSDGFVGGVSMDPTTGRLIFYNSAASGIKGADIVGLERFVINNLGNVGIGTSDPASKLDIKGTENHSLFYYDTNEDTYIRGGKATSNVIIGDVGNNVGLKTSLPYYDLTFKSDVGDKISFWGGETSATTNHYGIGIQPDQLQFFVPSYSDNIVFGTGRSASFIERMRITGNGNVGIGTSTPNNLYKLHVKTLGNSPGIVHENNIGISIGTYAGYGNGWLGTFSNHPLTFFVNNGGPAVTINTNEQLQVGNATTPAGFKMSVDGKLICTELEVKVTPWADYVFDKNYKLKPLTELELFIEKNHHLPNIPKAEDIESQSLALGNMAKLQMEKIEELTLYVIEINKRLQKVEEENRTLKNLLNK